MNGKMNIEYRKMNKADYPFIKNLIIQSWFSEYKFNDRVKYAYAEAYLRIYLADSNYRIVEIIELLLVMKKKLLHFCLVGIEKLIFLKNILIYYCCSL